MLGCKNWYLIIICAVDLAIDDATSIIQGSLYIRLCEESKQRVMT